MIEVTRGAVLPEVMLMTPRVFEDARGFFFESYHRARYLEAGIDAQFVQDNHARSQQGTLRGLHFQRRPGQAKLVRAVAGTVWDVAVDIRVGSSTFGRWEAWELDAARPQALFIPVGFAHGYVALRDAEVLYKVDAHYDPDEEKGFAWDDPDVGVRWPVAQPLVSARDREAPTLRTLFPRAF